MKRHRTHLLFAAVLAAGWTVYILIGGPLARVLSVRFGSFLQRVAEGKFPDPAVFIQHRLREALWLGTLLLAWAAAHILLNRLIRTRPRAASWQWAAQGLAGFVFLNVWISFAANTALFWAALGMGAGVQNYMQFQLKRVLAAEVETPRRAVLMGSSQTRTQIDEALLNQRLGGKLWTTELHFPGSKAYDLLLTESQLTRVKPQLVICYLTEGYLYAGSHGEPPANFLTFSQLSDAWQRHALHYLSGEEIGYGLLGDLVPLFRCREVISQRILGLEIANLKQAEYDASLAVDLEARAKESAKLYRIDAESDFQKQALEDFIIRCARADRRVVLLTGGYNPILMQQMSPAIRKDMLGFLGELQGRHSNLIVISASELPEQTATDYEDLSHVNRDMQQRFTAALATLIENQIDPDP